MVNRGEYAVLWDVDGVLIDSGEQHRRAWEQLAREEHLPYSDAAFWATFGMRNTDIFPRMFGIAGPPERIAALGDRKEAIYRALLAEDAVALPGAKELLAALHAVGYRQALGSSAPPANLEAIISLLDIAPLLDAVVSGEQVAHGKPAPDIFLAGAERLGVVPRTLPRHRRRARWGRRRPRGRDALPGGAPRGPARCARTRRRRRAGRLAEHTPASRWWIGCWASPPTPDVAARNSRSCITARYHYETGKTRIFVTMAVAVPERSAMLRVWRTRRV